MILINDFIIFKDTLMRMSNQDIIDILTDTLISIIMLNILVKCLFNKIYKRK